MRVFPRLTLATWRFCYGDWLLWLSGFALIGLTISSRYALHRLTLRPSPQWCILFENALICMHFALPSTLICSKTLSVFIENGSFWKRCLKWIVLKTLRYPCQCVHRKRIVYKTITSRLSLASTPAVIQNGGWKQRSVTSVEFDRVFTV